MELRKFIATNIREYLNENIRDERDGIGNYLETKKYNIINKETLPLSLLTVHDSATTRKYWDDTLDFFNFQKEIIPKDVLLHSTQKYVSKTFIDSINDEIYNNSDVIICEDEQKKLWLLNGHHRLVYDRINGKDSKGYILTHHDVLEIDDTFYNEDED